MHAHTKLLACRELLQNGDDNKYVQGVTPTVEFVVDTNAILVVNNEVGFQPSDIRSLCDIGNSSKVMRQAAGEQTIGEKGLGFKSVFAVTDCPQLFSRGFRLQFDCKHSSGLGYVLPEALDENSVPQEATKWGTAIRLPWKDEFSTEQRQQMISRMAQLSSALPLFLKQLRKIAVTTPSGRTDFEMVDLDRLGGRRVYCGGDRHEDWLVVHQDLAVPEGVQKPSANEGSRKTAQTNLQVAIPLSGSGGVDTSRGPLDVHAFLPVRSYGFRFAIQGDWVVSSSREEIATGGEWNEWLMAQLPSVLMTAIETCKRDPLLRFGFYRLLPATGEVLGFFHSAATQFMSRLSRSPCILTMLEIWVLPSQAFVASDKA